MCWETRMHGSWEVGRGQPRLTTRQSNPAVCSWALELAVRWLVRSGKRAAAIMGLIQSARLSGHDPYAYLKDVLTRLPTQRASEIAELLPHRWTPV